MYKVFVSVEVGLSSERRITAWIMAVVNLFLVGIRGCGYGSIADDNVSTIVNDAEYDS